MVLYQITVTSLLKSKETKEGAVRYYYLIPQLFKFLMIMLQQVMNKRLRDGILSNGTPNYTRTISSTLLDVMKKRSSLNTNFQEETETVCNCKQTRTDIYEKTKGSRPRKGRSLFRKWLMGLRFIGRSE